MSDERATTTTMPLFLLTLTTTASVNKARKRKGRGDGCFNGPSLSLFLIFSSSSSGYFAMAADDLAVAAAAFSGIKPEQLIVEGAGEEAVNGTYSLVSIFNDCGWYKKSGFYKGKEETFSIFREVFHDGSAFWNITIVPPGQQPLADQDIELYYTSNSNRNSISHPPTDGWKRCSGRCQGLDPPPTVRVVDAAMMPAHGVPTSCIIEPIASAYEKLLLSDSFSDVKLVCEDNAVIPAHRTVLAATSPYFNAAFSGPWKESNKGEITVSHSSRVVTTVLKMLYTGVIDVKSVAEDPVRFIAVAAEFDLPWLKEVAEKSCFESINEDNLKDFWQAARLFDCGLLKGRCVEYAKGNALAVLAHGGIVELRTVDLPSWDEFSNAIHKKARHE